MAAMDVLFDCFEEKIDTNAESGTGQSSKNVAEQFKYQSELSNCNIETKVIMQQNDCIHEVTHLANEPLEDLSSPSTTPAKTYKFTLDSFQKQSILCIENNQSVLVSAHTSAGKTVVAEYAIALSLKNKQRVIYTTPIKALSNQKYRELSHEFNDVGLMTGDVSIENSASCIVMTTEILRQMLYRGSQLMKEVQWVIFDEIHYMRDKERGIVWEESIILLPDSVRYVFLSATIPNARQFAEWITFLHHQPCNVVYTEYRPTPLQKYCYTRGRKLLQVVDEKSNFDENNFNAAFSDTGQSKEINTDQTIDLVKLLLKNRWTPILVFCFMREICEQKAMGMGDFSFNTDQEQALVAEVFNNAISILDPAEKQLPHVQKMLPLLRRGVAFHHGGLLPLIKEAIEILFGEGLIKVLFATETFAMGLNMPAKSVIFSQSKKFDGVIERFITSGEFIQMSGRAGRRGIDDKGIVVILVEKKEDMESYSTNMKEVLLGKAAPLNSAYHLTYNMILNLLRQEEVNPEYLIYKSFLYFQNHAMIQEKIKVLQEKQKNLNDIKMTDESYAKLADEIASIHEALKVYISNEKYNLKFLTPGRLIKFKTDINEYEWAVLLNVNFTSRKRKRNNLFEKGSYFQRKDRIENLEVILRVEKFNKQSCPPNYLPNPFSKNTESVVDKFKISPEFIYQISSEIVNVETLFSDPDKIQENYLKLMNGMHSKYSKFLGLALIHPVTDMKINTPAVLELVNRIENLENQLINHTFHKHKAKRRRHEINLYKKKNAILSEINILQSEIVNLGGNLEKELKQRKDVLRKLNYCDQIDVITLKGRVACEFSTYELILTEILLSGVLNTIPVDHCVGLLSCLLCTTAPPEELTLDKISEETHKSVKTLIRKIERVLKSVGLKGNDNAPFHRFHPTLISIVKAWCEGASFIDICNATTIYEGCLIRYMRGIEEILRQLYKAAKNIGNTDLEVKFSNGITRLKKGIVFASSLYL